MHTEIKLKIADIIIALRSESCLGTPQEREREERRYERFKNFLYRGHARPHIIVTVNVVDRLPTVRQGVAFFVTRHFRSRSENWRIGKYKKGFIYSCPIQGKQMVAFLERTFCRARVFLLAEDRPVLSWQLSDITDDFLHVLLINYLAAHNLGFFAHAAAVRERGGGGLLFCGKSEAGKSTTARIWHVGSNARVLNDDRIVVRRRAGRYFLYSVPWHGEFSRNFKQRLLPARLRRVFFLYQAPCNTAKRLEPARAFELLYSTAFPPFWDRRLLASFGGFIGALVRSVPGYWLGFEKNRRVIGFVRAIKAENP
jgi:hypothetical protein